MVILTSLSGVLISGMADVGAILADRFAVSPSGKRMLVEKCRQRFFKSYRAFQELLRGHIDEDRYLLEFFDGEKCIYNNSDIKAAISENLTRPMLDTLNVYQRIISYPYLSGKEYKGVCEIVKGMPDIYIVSDFWKERVDEVRNSYPGIFRVAKKEFWSCDINLVKQDPGFFPYFLVKSKLYATEIIFVDNSVRNVCEAGQYGIDGIVYNNPEQLETALSIRGFKFAPATP